MATTRERIEISEPEIDALLSRVRSVVSNDDYETLDTIVAFGVEVMRLLQTEGMTLRKLRGWLLAHRSSEKLRDIVEPDDATASTTTDDDAIGSPATEPSTAADGAVAPDPPKKRKGHGRKPAAAFPGAKTIRLTHTKLKPRDRCPHCVRGKIYPMKPRRQLFIVGQPPLHATCYEQDTLRCNQCGDVFTAELPAELDRDKYDASAVAMIALLKYGTGLPFYRLERLQGGLGIPLPAGTQWGLVQRASSIACFAFDELIRRGAQADVLHNDDTFIRILDLMAENHQRVADKERTGMFTTGIVALTAQAKIALFFTGRQHAGENIRDVLLQRASALGPPIQMCDGLDRNLPKDLEVILSNCTTHARRHFVDVRASFPDECRHVLEKLALVYATDAQARREELTPQQRLELHRAESWPVMEELKSWMQSKLADKHVEPNSGLGKAIKYTLKRWDPLTLFLRQPGAPLENNIVERALKKAILHRKNALFYKTMVGAKVGDIFMSLIYTCELNGVDPHRYLTALMTHPAEVEERPADWMPWNYRQALAPAA